MKLKQFRYLPVIVLTGLLSVSCLEEKYEDVRSNLNYANFDFKTTRNLRVQVETLNTDNTVLGGVGFSLYSQNPLREDGTLVENADSLLIFKGRTGNDGKATTVIAPPTMVDSITLIVNYVGLPALHQAKISGSELNFRIGGTTAGSAAPQKVGASVSQNLPKPVKIGGFYVLGGWSNSGFPDYLTATNDLIAKDLLEDINATLPEGIKLQDSHPEYFESKDEGSIVLIEDAEVWVTFVHEGAGYKNSLGYYTHPNDLPPAKTSSITDATVIFPNVSFSGSGGQLVSGNKVQLLYLNPVTNEYSRIFPAGTTVAWWFNSNGFNGGSANKLGTASYSFYSDVRFNPEKDPAKRKHNVLLVDEKRELLLIGFEDLHREQRPDDDFNDAVFYATVTPYRAIKDGIYKKIDTPTDTDNDGVSDTMDEYPNDPERAYNNYYPSKSQVGTLAFEDMWPAKGDYDFNDLVVDYRFNQVTNADNKVVEVEAEITLRAAGASLKNAFAIAFNTDASNVAEVTGQYLTGEVFKLSEPGVEANQKMAVIPVFDDPFRVFGLNGSIMNTINGTKYIAPAVINLRVKFKEPVDFKVLGTAPYNPFIVVGGERGREIHLPGSEPTQLADYNLFGTGHDNTEPENGKYYMSDKYLPWAINIPVQFAYPAEKEDITQAYLMFNNWAKSRGFNYMDWYMDKSNYRDVKRIFTKK